jgi:hypothetical protein
MPGHRHEWSECSSKKRFSSKVAAKVCATRVRGKGFPKARPYRCPECGMWHLSTCSADDREHHRRARREGQLDAA